MQSEQIDKLAAALSKAQAVMEAAAKNKRNPHFNSTYADLASIIESVRKPLTDNGLAFTQTILPTETGLFLETILLHTSGQWIRSEYPLLQGTAQQTGSSLTYARRYSLSSIAGIAADEDDDANAAAQANGKHPQRKLTKREVVTPLKASDVPAYAFAVPKLSDGGDDWLTFGTDLLTVIRRGGELVPWLNANKATLTAMRKAEPELHEKLLADIHETGEDRD